MSKKTKLIAGVNFKGGVGKSTLMSILASVFGKLRGKSCVVNIAVGQNAADINEVDTYDFSDQLAIDDTATVSDMISVLYDEYEYIFIDTPGELSDELVELLDYIDYFVVPYEDGQRCFNDTKRCIEAIFSDGIIEKDSHNLFLVHNSYTKDDDFESVKEDYSNFISKMANENNIKFNKEFAKLSFSKAVKTMEKKKSSIDTLSDKNKVAYRIFNKKAHELSDSLYTFLNN